MDLPPNQPFADDLEIAWLEDIGFNLDLTRKSGVIEGVVEDSVAYKAGLRNGQKFGCFDRNAEGLVSVIVVDANSDEREIRYTPIGNPPIPQYVIQVSIPRIKERSQKFKS